MGATRAWASAWGARATTDSRHARQEFLDATSAHADALYLLARRLTRDPWEAEDVVQEAYLHAYAAWLKGRPDQVRPWLVTICLNTARSRYRAARWRHEVVSDDLRGIPPQADEDPATEALRRVTAAQVHSALAGLPEQQRVAIALMDLCGLTADQVARATGSPRGTVLSRVHRGRKALALVLAPQVALEEREGGRGEPRP